MPRRNETGTLGAVASLLLVIILLPLILCYLAWSLTSSFLLYLAMWICWCRRGIRLLYIYSDSPNWQAYIESEILPRLPSASIVLNWSKRESWRSSLATKVFCHFGGGYKYNPMAVIIKPFRRARVFRFYDAFKDLKHGKPGALQRIETEFFQALR